VAAKQWKMEAQEENATRNKKNGKIQCCKQTGGTQDFPQAEAVVRGRKEKFSARALV
jgi:hypothetical protein